MQLPLVQRAAVGNTSWWVSCNGGDGAAGKVWEGAWPGGVCCLPAHPPPLGQFMYTLLGCSLAHPRTCWPIDVSWHGPGNMQRQFSLSSLCSSAGMQTQTSFYHLSWQGRLWLLLSSNAGSAASRLKAKERVTSSISKDSRWCRMNCGRKKTA